MAHLTTLAAKEKNIFGQECQVLSIAFGAPFCVPESIVNSMRIDEWTSQFVTVVNDDDPVPRILNVAATLESIEKTAELTAALCGVTAVQKALECGNALKGLLPELEAFIHKHDRTYQPLGVYLLVRGQDGGRVAESIVGEECKQKLGGAQLLCNGWVDTDRLVSHSMNGYKKACLASAVKSKFADSAPSAHVPEVRTKLVELYPGHFGGQLQIPVEVEVEVQRLPFKIRSAEFSVWDGAGPILNLHLVGQGLDFVGETAVKVQEAGDVKWRIHSCAETYILLQADISSTHCTTQLTTIKIEVTPDMHNVQSEDKNMSATKSSKSNNELQIDALEFNDSFLSTMMKAAWIFKNISQDDTGLVLLDNLDRLAKEHKHQKFVCMSPPPNSMPVYATEVLTFRKLVEKVSDLRSLQLVGSLDDETVQLHLKHVHEWLCPKEGHRLHTYQQHAGRVLCVVIGLAGVAAAATGVAALVGVSTVVVNGGMYLGSGLRYWCFCCNAQKIVQSTSGKV